MGSQKPSTWSVTLKRDGRSHPWGFRLAGGADLCTPLIVTKVCGGSPSERSLRVGDIIRKIEVYDARDLRHLDAQKLISDADQSITLVIERDAPQFNGGGGVSSSIISSPSSYFSVPDGGIHIPSTNCPVTVNGLYGYERAAQTPINNFRRFPPALVDSSSSSYDHNKSPHYDLPTIGEQQQPYRTNPLVLPGAKVKRDPLKTESYLRHHPNPMMRASPAHFDQLPMDTLMKQKVTDTVLQRISNEEAKRVPGRQVVHKQFNTPIGLYSEENIASSIKTQTGYTPLKKTVHYDPAKSETYKAIQESEHGDLHAQEISKPVQPKVFTPVQGTLKKAPVSNGYNQNKLPAPYHSNPGRLSPQPHPTAPHPNANYAMSTEEIPQSGSFKRLMHMVMTE